MSTIFSRSIVIPVTSIDENGHVNNVAFVQWMQEIAVAHYAAIGGLQAQGSDVTWVVREHRIQYLLPASAGEEIEMHTWIADVRRVRSLRKYEFVRKSDGAILVRGETDWIFVDVHSGRPVPIPRGLAELFAGSVGAADREGARS